MSEPYCFDIETLLNESQPASLLVIGSGANDAVQRYLEQKRLLGRDCRVDRPSGRLPAALIGRRYDLGIVTDTIEHLDKRDAIQLLSRLRDLHTARFCATVRIGEQWQALKSTWKPNELLGIGMTLVNSYEDDAGRRLRLYKYDIATYKTTPRWLNPDNWANPDLWNKYRW